MSLGDQDSHYRIDLRIHGDRLLVNMHGPAGPDAERHLADVRAAAARCDLDVVIVDKSRRWTI